LSYLIDSNLLLRWSQPYTAQHPIAVNAVAKLHTQGEGVVIVPQCLVEFWAVGSRPVSANGFGLSLTDVHREVQRIKQFFPLLHDDALVYPTWESLVYSVGVSGKQVHDARLVAAMHVHRISHILTFNGSDFARYQSAGPGIVVVDPGSI
jgi:predicted nucleic acid-binding protein